jgi:AraC-like DNA-binding protein
MDQISEAQPWLEETDLSIAEMAEKLGYRSEAAFNRAFKAFVGKTPGKVRRESSKSRSAFG